MHSANRFLAFLISFCLMIAVTAAALADITPLEMDLKVHGQPLKEECWNEALTVYEDESIRAELFDEHVKPKSSKTKIIVRYVIVEIKDPSQLRTTLSYESFENQKAAKAQNMAAAVNSVVAINDDQFKFNRFHGYVMRQGVFYQNTLEELEKPQDVLIIDDQADFSIVQKASTAAVEEKIAELAADGRKPVNVFTFGPALVVDGVGQECKTEDSIHSLHLPAARTVIGQLGHLKYFMMVTHGATSKHTGMKGSDLVDYILERFPDCKYAYNFDGGNSSKMVWHGKLKSDSIGGRQQITGLVYFASAVTGEDQP